MGIYEQIWSCHVTQVANFQNLKILVLRILALFYILILGKVTKLLQKLSAKKLFQ